MASYTHRIVTNRRHIWAIPHAEYGGHGAAIAEVQKAITAAEHAYRAATGKEPAYDDWLRVYAADDEILLWFDEETKPHE
ncbi:hypothetical protein [Nocardia puris]|uniref:Uncharacterized protein n=1 Tax=Nocardia puris TaxID=208602 RepID=A0A366CSI6_9NOCA|nr:hypothetical protein [Nocardia puris]RBO78312.1 hypothetical protein DFR74_1526 [Nocardia puris]